MTKKLIPTERMRDQLMMQSKAKGGSLTHDDVINAMHKAKSGQEYMNCKLAVQLASGVSKIQDLPKVKKPNIGDIPVSYTHLRAHET